MVVDDVAAMRITLEAIIEEEGYAVAVAEDGYQAIEMARAPPFDLVFMDIKMPGISGVEAFRQIKSVRPECRVVMMTGFSLENLVNEALAEGAHAVLHKPFDVEQVTIILKEVIKTGPSEGKNE
jgi:CheY-like chemotaxis protein